MIEALIANAPQDVPLRRLAAEGFSGAAFLFYEDTDIPRAKALYLRGRNHAFAALSQKTIFDGLMSRPLDDFLKILPQTNRDDVPELFWAAFSWAGYVNLSKDDASALADLPKIAALMTRVNELDPLFNFAGADLFFGVYYASRPILFGGDPKKSKDAFARAHKATKGEYLMTHVLNARWYAVAVQDRELFAQLLKKVLESPSGRLALSRLSDEAAKRKATVLLEKIDDFF
jgi:hypothetical protein